MGPRTVAQCWIGVIASPSLMCHSILDGLERLGFEWRSGGLGHLRAA